MFTAQVTNQTQDMSAILGDQANTYEQLKTTDKSASTPYQDLGNVQPYIHVSVRKHELLVV